MTRFYPNPFLDAAPPAYDAARAWSVVRELLPPLDECAARGAVPSSDGRWSRNQSVYTGVAGVAVAYLRVGWHARRADLGADARAYFAQARAVAEQCIAAEPSSEMVSFYCGTPGALAIAAVAARECGDDAGAEAHWRALLRWKERAISHDEDELLFGRAGYLYCLLWTRACGVGATGAGSAEANRAIREVSDETIRRGVAISAELNLAPRWPLAYRCFGEPYLGAAHGTLGVVTMLLRAHAALPPDLALPRGTVDLLRGTVDALLGCRHASSNLPIVLGDRRDEHVHWYVAKHAEIMTENTPRYHHRAAPAEWRCIFRAQVPRRARPPRARIRRRRRARRRVRRVLCRRRRRLGSRLGAWDPPKG